MKPEFHYRVSTTRNCPPIISQLHPLYIVNPHFARFNFSIISHPRLVSQMISSMGVLRLTFLPKGTLSVSHVCYIPFLSHSPWFDDRNDDGEECKLRSSLLCNFLLPPVITSFLNLIIPPRSTVPTHPGSVLPYVTDSASRGFERRGTLNCTALHNNHFLRAGANLIYLAEPIALTVEVLQRTAKL